MNVGRHIVSSGIAVALALFTFSNVARADVEWMYPSPDTAWGPSEYAQFQNVYFNAHLALPHLRSAGPKRLFKHLIDWNNVREVLTNDRDPWTRDQSLRIMLAATGAIRSDYNVNVVMEEPLQEELTEVQLFDLRLSGVMLSTTPNLTASDVISAKTRFDGILQSLDKLGGQTGYTAQQRAALALAAAAWFRQFSSLYETDERRSLFDIVKLIIGKAEGAEDIRALQSLLSAVTLSN